ncbi:MAG TPA: hypothetical protein VM925_13050 [Labilithrix sp.]|nr:hypothetical protein [Labilithrix sp.]
MAANRAPTVPAPGATLSTDVRSSFLRACGVCIVAFAGACASTDSRPGSGGIGTPFTVWVFEERFTLDDEDKPLPNVRVVFDPPGGGERATRTTAADGHVTFDGDFARGGGSVTVLSNEHVYVTMLEASPETARARPNAIGKPASDLVVLPPRLDRITEPRTVELRGTIFGKRDRNHVVSIAASSLPRLGAYRALESTYVVRAPRDRPFFVLGHETRTLLDRDGVVVENELLKAFRIEMSARADDQVLDLDLPKLPSLPTKVIHVRAETPQVGASPFGAGTRAFASVGSVDSGLGVGLFARTSPSADGHAFDIDVTLVETDVTPERLLSDAVLIAADGSQSTRTEQGTMADGMVWKDFALPPSIPDADASRTVRDPIPLDGFPAGADLVAKVYAGGGQLLWILNGPPGGPRGKTFTIPYRDEVASVDIQLFALSLSARMDRVPLASRGEFYRYTSTFRDVLLGK